jgi:hypothetical protein
VFNKPTIGTDPTGNYLWPWEAGAQWQFSGSIFDTGTWGGATTGAGIGAVSGAAGAALGAIGLVVLTTTPFGWAAVVTVIIVGAVVGTGAGASVGSIAGGGKPDFGSGAAAAATQPATYIGPFVIGVQIGASLYLPPGTGSYPPVGPSPVPGPPWHQPIFPN